MLLLDIDRLLSAGEAEEVAQLGARRRVGIRDGPGCRAGVAPAGLGAALGSALVALLLLAAPAARAQEEQIQDNSFLIEEAYNQERGVVQHINAFSRIASSGDWIYTFTQEWPLPSLKHQVSFTLPVQELHSALATSAGVGDVAFNYRYQAIGSGETRVAFSPRLSLLVPTGQSRRGLGTGGVALQVNLPLSWAWGSHLVTHWNAGWTHTYSARNVQGDRAGTNALNLGQSLIWLAHPRFNVMLETAYVRAQAVAGERATETSDALYPQPGHPLGAQLQERAADRARRRLPDRHRAEPGGARALPVRELRAPVPPHVRDGAGDPDGHDDGRGDPLDGASRSRAGARPQAVTRPRLCFFPPWADATPGTRVPGDVQEA